MRVEVSDVARARARRKRRRYRGRPGRPARGRREDVAAAERGAVALRCGRALGRFAVGATAVGGVPNRGIEFGGRTGLRPCGRTELSFMHAAAGVGAGARFGVDSRLRERRR